MRFSQRASGILLHPTSLPSDHGIGDLGREAFRFIDYLVESSQSYWQILPLGPTSYGNSPYASVSTFAGNPLLIDVEQFAVGARAEDLLESVVDPGTNDIDYDHVIEVKGSLLRQLASRFLETATPPRRAEFEQFCDHHRRWLDDYTLFVAIKAYFDRQASDDANCSNSAWNVYWDTEIARRQPSAMATWTRRCECEIQIEKVLQFHFFEQWRRLKSYANERGVRLIGDVPIFVALDSADVWAAPHQFLLDADLQPQFVAGVPPDYFSSTGQRWGNPLYDWDAMRDDGFDWWMRRFAATLQFVDVVRLDHFRGFSSCWAIPAGEPLATQGQWLDSPGDELFLRLKQVLGPVELIAEDLGVITDDVEQLRQDHHFPGMRILQFAFDENETRREHFLPQNYDPHTVVYTGTHDNSTVHGWFTNQSETVQQNVLQFIGESCGDVAWDFIRLAMHSSANTAIAPMQDVLSLNDEARLNLPGTIGANWRWRLPCNYTASGTASKLADLVSCTHRNSQSGQSDVRPPHSHYQTINTEPKLLSSKRLVNVEAT
ncbi:4-alpha-glucanotransferase [Rhodopirellula rubra]|uniref:4-alpha-glucanotransferase n=1 Tax=Aporhodopirellula rubra TaxID=980271 RepID=A0A7W5H8N9_9BACT|nr:4-alpha-glucanotransferase [Aporhodopirellula rubra]MBB3209211.1 4-alpha-glucanotransferase [Aporhodopirellula rubra]